MHARIVEPLMQSSTQIMEMEVVWLSFLVRKQNLGGVRECMALRIKTNWVINNSMKIGCVVVPLFDPSAS